MNSRQSEQIGCVIALAGRRVDPPKAETVRFPPEQIGRVADRIRELFVEKGAHLLVCAAACGVDILALEVAGQLGLRCRVVLPAQPATFREGSVTDRPGDWGERYDHILSDLEPRGDLVITGDDSPASGQDYFQANIDILNEANRLAAELGLPVEAVVVWNGVSRGDDDVTAHFRSEAIRRALRVTEILTVGDGG